MFEFVWKVSVNRKRLSIFVNILTAASGMLKVLFYFHFTMSSRIIFQFHYHARNLLCGDSKCELSRIVKSVKVILFRSSCSYSVQ